MSPLLYSLKWFGRVCFVNKCYWDHIQKIFITRHILIIQMFFAYSLHYVSVFYSYLYNYSIGNGRQQQFVQYYIYTYKHVMYNHHVYMCQLFLCLTRNTLNESQILVYYFIFNIYFRYWNARIYLMQE